MQNVIGQVFIAIDVQTFAVVKASRREMEWVLKRSRPSFHFEVKSDFIVQLKGLPLDCSNDDITHLLKGNNAFVCSLIVIVTKANVR